MIQPWSTRGMTKCAHWRCRPPSWPRASVLVPPTSVQPRGSSHSSKNGTLMIDSLKYRKYALTPSCYMKKGPSMILGCLWKTYLNFRLHNSSLYTSCSVPCSVQKNIWSKCKIRAVQLKTYSLLPKITANSTNFARIEYSLICKVNTHQYVFRHCHRLCSSY